MIALNFGCGKNRLEGWRNFDADVDIAMRLPFEDGAADFILAEHVVEHVVYEAALGFFAECRRVLKTGGIVRIAVPSLENIWRRADDEYLHFVHSRGWAREPTRRGAMNAILRQHGHKAPWTASLLAASLYFAGFDEVEACEPGQSRHASLCDIEGHGRIIGHHRNWIESAICEAA